MKFKDKDGNVFEDIDDAWVKSHPAEAARLMGYEVVEVVHGHWNIRCDSHYDTWTGETDEEFYLECSECRRKVWDIDQMAAMDDDHRKLIADFPYCHCGAKMEV